MSLTVAQKLTPYLSAPNSWNFTYGQSIVAGSLSSTLFTQGNLVEFFADDSKGNINICTADAQGNVSIVQKNIGTIDYKTGIGVISNISINSYVGNTLDIVATTVLQDISSYNNAILLIYPTDVSTSVNSVRV